jgi:hypothetical protein
VKTKGFVCFACFIVGLSLLFMFTFHPITHSEQGHHDPNNPAPTGEKIFKDDELVQLNDPILNNDDVNKDGFIDYPEYVQAQQNAGGGGRQPT